MGSVTDWRCTGVHVECQLSLRCFLYVGKGGLMIPSLFFSFLFDILQFYKINWDLGEWKHYTRNKKYAFRYYNNDCFDSVLFGL